MKEHLLTRSWQAVGQAPAAALLPSRAGARAPEEFARTAIVGGKEGTGFGGQNSFGRTVHNAWYVSMPSAESVLTPRSRSLHKFCSLFPEDVDKVDTSPLSPLSPEVS